MKQENPPNTAARQTVPALELAAILEAIQQHARTCETASQDSTQEALTGESKDKEEHLQNARIWLIKSQVWLEAEAVVRGIVLPADRQAPGHIIKPSSRQGFVSD